MKMNDCVCPRCGGKVKQRGENVFCLKCGREFDLDVFASQIGESEETFQKNSNWIREGIFLILKIVCPLAFCFALIYGLFSSGILDSEVTKILDKNGYEKSRYKIAQTIDLPGGIIGLYGGDNANKLVLANDHGYYGYAVVNVEQKTVTVPTYGYIPLNEVQQYIWRQDENTNISCMELYEKYITKYGVYCMESKECAESYLRELTKEGIVPLEVAKSIVIGSTMKIFPNINSVNDIMVFFEKGTAVPTYYATQSVERVYRGIFPNETTYKVWKANTDIKTQKTMEAIYGEQYVLENVWAVVDSNLNPVGTYKSLEEVRKKFEK